MALTSGSLGSGVQTGPTTTPTRFDVTRGANGPGSAPSPQALAQQLSMGSSSMGTYAQAALPDLTKLQIDQSVLERQKPATWIGTELDSNILANSANADLARLGVDANKGLQDRGFANRAFDLAKQLLDNSLGRDLRLSSESATARGAMVSQGHRAELGEINGAYQGQLGQAALAKDKALGGLDAEAAKRGISGDEMRKALWMGLQRLGLQGSISFDQIEAMLQSNSIDQQSLANAIVNKAFETDQATGGAPMAPSQVMNWSNPSDHLAGQVANIVLGQGDNLHLDMTPADREQAILADAKNEPIWHKIWKGLIGG